MTVQGGSLPGVVIGDLTDLSLYISLHPQYGMIIGSEFIFTMEWRGGMRVTQPSWLCHFTGIGG